MTSARFFHFCKNCCVEQTDSKVSLIYLSFSFFIRIADYIELTSSIHRHLQKLKTKKKHLLLAYLWHLFSYKYPCLHLHLPSTYSVSYTDSQPLAEYTTSSGSVSYSCGLHLNMSSTTLLLSSNTTVLFSTYFSIRNLRMA